MLLLVGYFAGFILVPAIVGVVDKHKLCEDEDIVLVAFFWPFTLLLVSIIVFFAILFNIPILLQKLGAHFGK